MDEKVFSVASPDNQQKKVSSTLRELLNKKHSIFFSVGNALPSRLSIVPVSCNFLNSLFTPRVANFCQEIPQQFFPHNSRSPTLIQTQVF